MLPQSNSFRKGKPGRFFMMGLKGSQLDDDAITLMEKYSISKFILFSRNTTEGPKKLKALCDDIKRYSKKLGLKPLIAIDQEGGPVRRLRPPLFPDIPSQKEIKTANDPIKKMKELAQRTANLLLENGINVNFAPCLDLCLDAESHVLKGRCFGNDINLVSRLGEIYVETMNKIGVICVAKHFPGIGRVKLDPHHHLPKINTKKEIILKEATPFKRAISRGVKGIMTSHVIYKDIDPENPATLSEKIANKILRKDFDFKGPLFSDDMEMKGILGQFEIGKACLKSFMAGHDIILICSDYSLVEKALDDFKKGLYDGIIKKERLSEALSRIERLNHP